MCYSLHYKLRIPTFGRGQNTIPSTELGWNDPTGHFGHAVSAKGGVVPAQTEVLPAPKFFFRA